MSSSSDRAQPHWGRPAPAAQPARPPAARLGLAGPKAPSSEVTAETLEAVLAELRDLRKVVDDRLRSIGHRLDGLDTDVLRLITLVRREDDSSRV